MSLTYKTALGGHCYYGNLANILHYYQVDCSEAELVLFLDALNGIYSPSFAPNVYLGLENIFTSPALEALHCGINKIFENTISECRDLLRKGIPVLMTVPSNHLKYHTIYRSTDRMHTVVLLREQDGLVFLSDCFVQTVPISVYEGYTASEEIYDAVRQGEADVSYVRWNPDITHLDKGLLFAKLIQYLDDNIHTVKGSMVANLQAYHTYCVSHIQESLHYDVLQQRAYNISATGMVMRFNYLKEYILTYGCLEDAWRQRLDSLEKQWMIVKANLLRCSETLNPHLYYRVFHEYFPDMITGEQELYAEIRKKLDKSHLRNIR